MKNLKNKLTFSFLLASGLIGLSPVNANTDTGSRDLSLNKVLEYEFETSDVYTENGITYVKDISGNNRDAKLMGNAKANGVLDLTSNTASAFTTNGYAIAPEGTLEELESYTFFMMVKPNHLNGSPRIYDFGGSAGNSLFGRASALTAGMKYNDGGTQMVNSGRALNVGEENYLAFVFDATTKVTRIYLNGTEVANGEDITHKPNEITSVINDSRNYIGRTQWWDSHVASSNIDYCGTIDHFQLYNTALSTEEVRDLQRPYSEPEVIESYSGMSVTKEGAWCWFADPRALHYEDSESGINSSYIGYIDVHGNVKAMQYDFTNNTSSEVLIRSYFQPDDHNNPTFLVLPDKRIMIFYSRHTDEACFYYRVSTKPGDISSLGEEKVIRTSHNTTYPSPFILADDPEHIYLCWRGINWHPTIAQLTLPDENDNVEFSWGPYQMVQSTGARPYAKYYSNGKDKLYLTYTTGHPDNESPNYVYFNMVDIKSLTLQDIKGNTLSKIENGPFKVYKTSSYVSSYPNTVVDNPSNQRDWVWQVSEDKNGYPVIAMVRISPDKTSHDYYYAQWTGSEWKKTFLANAGGHFHQTPGLEMCYSAGMAIDPERPNEIYCSVPVMGVYEIVKYTVNEDGSLTSEAVTRNSLKNNVRPYILPGYKGEEPQLVWMYGEYYDWIVSSSRPKGYPTEIRRGFDFADTATDIENGIVKYETFDSNVAGSAKTENGTLVCTESTYGEIAADVNNEFTISLSAYIYSGTYRGTIFETGNTAYSLNKDSWKPEIRIGETVYKSSNILGNSDCWQNEGRGTGGQWPTPEKFKYFNLTITYTNGVLTSYINGLIDQKISAENISINNLKIGGFNGWVEDARIYNRAINQAEIMELTEKSISYSLDSELISELELQTIYVPETAVTDIVLPSKSSSGLSIEWKSDNEDIISNTGCVSYPAEITDVNLSATISGKTKDYTVSVLPRDIEKNKVVAYTFETDDCYETNGEKFVKDLSGNNNDLRIMGSAVIDGSLNLTANTASGFATNGYAVAPSGILDSIRSYSFVLEVTPKHLNSQPRLYDFGSSSGNSVFGRGSKLTAGIKYNGQTTKMVDSNKSLTIGQSSIVAFVYDAKTKLTKIYINGTESGSGSYITQEIYQLAEIASDTRNYIGRTQWWDTSEKNNNQDFCGTIDNFYLFNTALSAEEIKDLNDQITGIGTTVVNNGTFDVYPGIIGKNETATIGYQFSAEELQGLCVSVIDLNGRTVKQINPKSNPVVLDGFKNAGCYIIKAANTNSTWTSKIIVK